MTVRKPLIVGIGGTTRPGSSSECALQCALRTVEAGGGETRLLGGDFLSHLPIFNPANADQTDEQKLLADTVRQADGVIVASISSVQSVSRISIAALRWAAVRFGVPYDRVIQLVLPLTFQLGIRPAARWCAVHRRGCVRSRLPRPAMPETRWPRSRRSARCHVRTT